jgi:hypothetical protein
MNPRLKSFEDIRRLAASELSMRARLSYVALLLVSSAATAGLLSLWITEAYLPLRTQLAFGALTLICASWATLSVVALTTRRVLFARDRVIAGIMSVAFTALFLAGAVAAVLMTGSAAAFAAAATGVVMFGVALRVLAAARRRFASLAARRAELERELAGGAK